MDLVKQVAKHYFEEVKKNDMKDPSETKADEKKKHVVDKEKTTKHKSLVFSESIMDNFIH